MYRETVQTSQTDGARERFVRNQRVTALSPSLKAQLKNLFFISLDYFMSWQRNGGCIKEPRGAPCAIY